jgi:hypothetical protein
MSKTLIPTQPENVFQTSPELTEALNEHIKAIYDGKAPMLTFDIEATPFPIAFTS